MSNTYVDDLEYLVAMYTYYMNKAGLVIGSTTRVASTTDYSAALMDPQSGYQLYQYIKVLKGEMFVWFGSAIQNQLFILMVCLWTDPNADQCTNNIWADIKLNAGQPDHHTIWGILNVFTWEGWLTMVVWALVLRLIYGFFGNLGTGLLGVIYWTFEDPEWEKPFCKPGELEIFGTDCAEWMKALGYYNGKEDDTYEQEE